MGHDTRLKPLYSWRSAILDSELAPMARFVALALSTYMSERGDSAFPGAVRLARDTGLSERAVRRYLGVLVRAGWLDLVAAGGRRGEKRRANEYRALIPDPPLPLHNIQGYPCTTVTREPESPVTLTTATPAPGAGHLSIELSIEEHTRDPFDEWWEGYPRKIDKARARAAYGARRKQGVTVELLDAAREHYAAAVADSDPRYIKHPATFLHGATGPWSEYLIAVPAQPKRAAKSTEPPTPTRVVDGRKQRFMVGTGWMDTGE